jgi:lactocepin
LKLRKVKKYAAVGLVSMLAVSNSAAGVSASQTDAVETDQLVLLDDTVQEQAVLTPELSENEKVRVIVELEGDAPISESIEQGVRYKDLAESVKQGLESEVKAEQSEFLSDLKAAKNIDFKVENTYTTLVNGFSGEIAYGQIDELESLPNVESVSIVNEYERPTEKPEMITSKEMVKAIQTWNAGFTGKGMVVGIIDTGVDPTHKDMVLNTDPKHKLTQAKVNQLVKDNSLPGKYYTLKVPYGYNYADKNSEILDLGPAASMHGMHVGGTVGANGNEQNGGIKGVAPDSQLLALKVFGNDPQMASTWGDIYVKAIDDAIKLGADVLNMSLGSVAGFVSPDNFEQKALERAVNSGVLMSVSAGNSAQIGNGTSNPLASNPDIGLVGAPGLTTNSISVANIENTHITLDEFKVKIGTETLPIAFKKQNSPTPMEVFGTTKELDVVYVGDGSAPNYAGKDVKGKVVFAVRTDLPNYGQIQAQAMVAGAAAVIIRGAVAHGDYVSMGGLVPDIPVVGLGIDEGNLFEAKIKAAGGVGKVTFTGLSKSVPNNASGYMSASTSWGVTPNLDLKPELTAPGGQIYSTFNDNKYGLMSGTSMAAPHVSGGAALVLQKVQEKFPTLQGADKVKMVKTLLMNTAKPVVDPVNNGLPFSPRRQGAGIMQLHSAIETPVYVVRKGTQDAKVQLKEISTDKFDMTITATNTSNKDVSYTVNTSVLTDAVSAGRNALKTQAIAGAVVTTDSPTVTLFPGASKDITVRVDLTNAKAPLEALMKNGYFVEGFITLTNNSQDVTVPDLAVPYVGFKGDWNSPPVLDATRYDTGSYYGFSGFVDQNGTFVGKDPFSTAYLKNKLAISPNGDGIKEKITPVLQFLRNSKTVEYSIVDAEGKQLRKIRTDSEQRKNYFAATTNYSYKSITTWDGLVNNKLAADGLYYYQIKTQVDNPGETPQVVKYPVFVDNTAPIVSSLAYSSKNNLLSFIATDANGSGLDKIEFYVDGKLLGSVNPTGKTEFLMNTTGWNIKNSVDVVAYDNAGNKHSMAVSAPGDNTIPYITSDSPVSTGTYSTLELPVRGSIKDGSRVASLQVRSANLVGGPTKSLTLVYNPVTKTYDFNTQISFTEDGVHDVFIEGVDVVGNAIEFRRQIYIDTQAAGLEITGLPENNVVAADGQDPVVTVKLTDNFDEFRLVVNGNEEASQPFNQPYEQRALAYEHTMTLALKDGRNDFVFEATDSAGLATKKNVSIFKGDAPTAFITSFNVTPDTQVSTATPATITAEASESIVWDVQVIDPDGTVVTLPSAEGKTYSATFTPDELALSGQYTVVLSPADSASTDKIVSYLTVVNRPITLESVETFNANGESTNTFTADSSVSIVTNLKNVSQTVSNPTVLVQVRDAHGAVAFIGEVNVDAINRGALNRFGVAIPLAGFDSGSYTVEVLVWDSLNNALPVAESSKVGIFNVN